MATLLIVEDDKQTNEAICEYLKSAGHKVIPAFDGADALQIFSQENIDLVVLDIMLPKITGLGILHEIRKKDFVPILMLTAIEDEYTQVTSFDEQADDYITKPFSMVLLGKRITALLRRSGKGVVSNTMSFGDVTVDFSGYTAKDPNGKIDITPKEIDLLKLLAEHKGLVLTHSQILDDLWGIDAPIIDRTIDTYIKNLRKKLHLKSTLMIFERHANLKYKYGNRHFWCRGYYVDTVGKNAKKIQEYIRNQLKEDLEYDQMTLKEYIDPFTGEPVKQSK